jgi:hypothetical protein
VIEEFRRIAYYRRQSTDHLANVFARVISFRFRHRRTALLQAGLVLKANFAALAQQVIRLRPHNLSEPAWERKRVPQVV